MIRKLLCVLSLPTVLCAQGFYPRLEMTELLIDPVGVNAGQQLVEVTVGNAPVNTAGFHLVAGTVVQPFPSLVLPAFQLLRLHLGASGVDTIADLYFPAFPVLAISDSLAIFQSNQVQNVADLVDFVCWGGTTGPHVVNAIQAGRWSTTLESAVLPTVEGATLANRTFARSAWVGAEAWYRDTTPTLGLPNDPGMTWNLAMGCPSAPSPPWLGTNDPVDGGPWAGQLHTVIAYNLQPTQGVLFLAFGSTTTGPVALDPVGMPGCFSHIAIDAVFVVFHALGQGQFAYVVPTAPSFVGFAYYLQALVPVANAGNPLGALVTNALMAQIGSR